MSNINAPQVDEMFELKNFLIKAKRKGWANEDSKEERIVGTKTNKIYYEEAPYLYEDSWNGSNPFIGKEIVVKRSEPMHKNVFPIWGMVYYGKLTDEKIDKTDFNRFLKEALRNIDEDFPFRGPLNFKKNGLEYINGPEGNLMEFGGQEFVRLEGEEIFRLNYGGGLIKL